MSPFVTFFSGARVTMNTAVVNEAGLNVWSVMADCLIKLVLQHEKLTDTKNDNVTQKYSDPNLATVYSFLLTPIFLAGNTKDSPSVRSLLPFNFSYFSPLRF